MRKCFTRPSLFLVTNYPGRVIRFVVLLMLLAALLYGLFWAIDRRNSGGTGSAPAQPKPRGPVGPDDDEAFLRDLGREQRRRQRGSGGSSSIDPPANPPTNPKADPDANPQHPTSQERNDNPE
jgi:hypothetical protein